MVLCSLPNREIKAPPLTVATAVAAMGVLLLADEANEPPNKRAKGSQPGRKQALPRFLSRGNADGLRREEWLVVAPEGRRHRVPSSVACLSLNVYVPEGPTGGKGVLSGPKKESPEGRHVNR